MGKCALIELKISFDYEQLTASSSELTLNFLTYSHGEWSTV